MWLSVKLNVDFYPHGHGMSCFLRHPWFPSVNVFILPKLLRKLHILILTLKCCLVITDNYGIMNLPLLGFSFYLLHFMKLLFISTISWNDVRTGKYSRDRMESGHTHVDTGVAGNPAGWVEQPVQAWTLTCGGSGVAELVVKTALYFLGGHVKKYYFLYYTKSNMKNNFLWMNK